MSKIEMTLGVDVPAYCRVELPEGTDLSEKSLRKLAGELSGDQVFNPDWGQADRLRVVLVENGDDFVADSIPVNEGEMIPHQGFAKIGTTTVTVDFLCRQYASKEDKDAAFLDALRRRIALGYDRVPVEG